MTDPLSMVGLPPLMDQTTGRADVVVAILDGPVAVGHPDLAQSTIRPLGHLDGNCTRADSLACQHGTFVAGILCADRATSLAPAICPGCTVLNRPVLSEQSRARPIEASPGEVAQAIFEAVRAGSLVINMSLAMSQSAMVDDPDIAQALNYALTRGAIVVAAAGNEGTLSSTTITRHAAVIPVVAYDRDGGPFRGTNLSASAARRGLGAPGVGIRSLSPDGGTTEKTGTSFAAAIVTGVVALLWSLFPHAGSAKLKTALRAGRPGGTAPIVPPLVNAWRASEYLKESGGVT